MKKVFLLSIGWMVVSTAHSQDGSFEQLVKWIEGSYSSADQAADDSAYFNCELEMVRIFPRSEEGQWFYVEQAAAAKKDAPHRQRLYHLRQKGSSYTSTIYSLHGADSLIGAYKDAGRFFGKDLAGLASELEGCTITLSWKKDHFAGSTKDRECKNSWSGASYATSVVEVFEGKMLSWDRGWNEKGEYVWGAEKGPYEFVKKR